MLSGISFRSEPQIPIGYQGREGHTAGPVRAGLAATGCSTHQPPPRPLAISMARMANSSTITHLRWWAMLRSSALVSSSIQCISCLIEQRPRRCRLAGGHCSCGTPDPTITGCQLLCSISCSTSQYSYIFLFYIFFLSILALHSASVERHPGAQHNDQRDTGERPGTGSKPPQPNPELSAIPCRPPGSLGAL